AGRCSARSLSIPGSKGKVMKKLLLFPLAMALAAWMALEGACSAPHSKGPGHSSAYGRSNQTTGRSQVSHPLIQKGHPAPKPGASGPPPRPGAKAPPPRKPGAKLPPPSKPGAKLPPSKPGANVPPVPKPGAKVQPRHPRLPHYPQKWGKPTVTRYCNANPHLRCTPGWEHTARCFGWRHRPATWHYRCGNHCLIARGYPGWTYSCWFPRYHHRMNYCVTMRDWYFYSHHFGCYVPCRVFAALYACEGQGEAYGNDPDVADYNDNEEEGDSLLPPEMERALERMLRGHS